MGTHVCVVLGQVAEEDGDQVNADHSPPVSKPVCVNGTEAGSLNSKAKAERRSSSSSNPSRKGVSTASKIRKLSTCKQQWPSVLFLSQQLPTWWVCALFLELLKDSFSILERIRWTPWENRCCRSRWSDRRNEMWLHWNWNIETSIREEEEEEWKRKWGEGRESVLIFSK